MCFYNDGPDVVCQVNAVVRTRKQHRCEECGAVIPKGDLAENVTGLCDGSWFSGYFCGACEKTRHTIHEHEIAEGCHWAESWCPVGELEDYCRESGIEMATAEEGRAFLASRRVTK
mgnify:FL=1